MLVFRFLVMADPASVGPRAPESGVVLQIALFSAGPSFYTAFRSWPCSLTSKKILARLARAARSLARIFLLPLFSLPSSCRPP
jgi:hypothetical protein